MVLKCEVDLPSVKTFTKNLFILFYNVDRNENMSMYSQVALGDYDSVFRERVPNFIIILILFIKNTDRDFTAYYLDNYYEKKNIHTKYQSYNNKIHKNIQSRNEFMYFYPHIVLIVKNETHLVFTAKKYLK